MCQGKDQHWQHYIMETHTEDHDKTKSTAEEIKFQAQANQFIPSIHCT